MAPTSDHAEIGAGARGSAATWESRCRQAKRKGCTHSWPNGGGICRYGHVRPQSVRPTHRSRMGTSEKIAPHSAMNASRQSHPLADWSFFSRQCLLRSFRSLLPTIGYMTMGNLPFARGPLASQAFIGLFLASVASHSFLPSRLHQTSMHHFIGVDVGTSPTLGALINVPIVAGGLDGQVFLLPHPPIKWTKSEKEREKAPTESSNRSLRCRAISTA